MRHSLAKLVFIALLAGFLGASARAQSAVTAEPERGADAGAIRVIRDPHTGLRWLLRRDPSNPGGPGRLALMAGEDDSESRPRIATQAARSLNPDARTPAIRSGDRLVVEKNSAIVEARLEAVALSSANESAVFLARLAIGGKVVRAVALGPGRAEFAPDAEEKR